MVGSYSCKFYPSKPKVVLGSPCLRSAPGEIPKPIPRANSWLSWLGTSLLPPAALIQVNKDYAGGQKHLMETTNKGAASDFLEW